MTAFCYHTGVPYRFITLWANPIQPMPCDCRASSPPLCLLPQRPTSWVLVPPWETNSRLWTTTPAAVFLWRIHISLLRSTASRPEPEGLYLTADDLSHQLWPPTGYWVAIVLPEFRLGTGSIHTLYSQPYPGESWNPKFKMSSTRPSSGSSSQCAWAHRACPLVFIRFNSVPDGCGFGELLICPKDHVHFWQPCVKKWWLSWARHGEHRIIIQ